MAEHHTLRWKFDENSTVTREFFIRKHRSPDKNPDKPEDRTVVILNIPPYITEESLRNVLTPFGGIERVLFHKHPTPSSPDCSSSTNFPNVDDGLLLSYKVTYVVFRSPKVPGKLFIFADGAHAPLILSTPDSPIETGLSVWTKEHRKPLLSLVDLKKEIDVYMEKYDATVEAEKLKAKQTEGVADEDGWVTVTRVGKKRGTRQTDVMASVAETDAKKKAQEKRDYPGHGHVVGKSTAELLNFYKFQKGGGKLKELGELRKKFEEDKQKISQMKAARKFKPY